MAKRTKLPNLLSGTYSRGAAASLAAAKRSKRPKIALQGTIFRDGKFVPFTVYKPVKERPSTSGTPCYPRKGTVHGRVPVMGGAA